jgi:transposase InsO family protein
LKTALTTDPVLGHFNPDRPIELHTDASAFGIGAVIVQRNDEGERPIAYASRTLTSAERNYSTTERECLAIVWAITKFRPYLYGQAFDVVTDHHALCWLASLKDPSGRLARWSLRLQEYDIQVIYKSGKRHLDADALSRSPRLTPTRPVVAVLQIRTTADLITFQKDDLFCGPILKYLGNRTKVSTSPAERKLQSKWNKMYVKRNDILYRRGYNPEGEVFRVVVPRALRETIVEFHHDDPQSGHLGFAKTVERICRSCFWPGMQRYIRNYVHSCSSCQRRKNTSPRIQGQLQSIEPPAHPFHTVGIDFLGPLPRSNNGNRHLLVAIDYLTRFAETRAVPQADSHSVARFHLEQIVLRHGSPARLISDRGKAFLSQMVKDVFHHCNTIHKTTTSYHPQCNGLVERFNHTLADMISMYVNADHTNWDDILPFVTYAYNTSVQSSSTFTPFRLVYGREVSSPLDAILNPPGVAIDVESQSFVDLAEQARATARVSIKQAQESQRIRYDTRSSLQTYNVGDHVLVWFPSRRVGLAEKLLRKYFGPYEVVRQSGPVDYVVSTLPRDANSKLDTVHVNRMKLFNERSPEDLA